MPGKLTESELAELVRAPEIGVLCTVDADGRPEGSPIWFEAVSGTRTIHVHVGRDSKKARNVRANANVSLTIDTRVAPYRGAVLRGTVRELPFDQAIHERVAVRYLGKDGGAAYLEMTAGAEAETVLLELSVDSRYTWDYAKGF